MTPIIDLFLVLLSVKIVSESVILDVDLHNTKVRPFEEEKADNELFVVYYGPEIGEAEDILKEVLAMHFKDSHGWHFTTNNYFKKNLSYCCSNLYK